MESLLYPLCVDEYCNYFGVNPCDLTLPCIFCKVQISSLQLATFNERRLSLVWRGDRCFAACINCINRVAEIERLRYFQCTLKGEYIEYFTQQALQDLIIRCLYCMGLLTNEEKIDVIASGLNFYLVRGYWKGVCYNCSYNAGGNSHY